VLKHRTEEVALKRESVRTKYRPEAGIRC
jgi:hypothetical protein